MILTAQTSNDSNLATLNNLGNLFEYKNNQLKNSRTHQKWIIISAIIIILVSLGVFIAVSSQKRTPIYKSLKPANGFQLGSLTLPLSTTSNSSLTLSTSSSSSSIKLSINGQPVIVPNNGDFQDTIISNGSKTSITTDINKSSNLSANSASNSSSTSVNITSTSGGN